MFRPIRMDHTNCLQVAIKSIQFQSTETDHLQGACLVCVQGLWCHVLIVPSRSHKPGAEGEFGFRPVSSITVGHGTCHIWDRTEPEVYEKLWLWIMFTHTYIAPGVTSYC
jgi:hypothetical protein